MIRSLVFSAALFAAGAAEAADRLPLGSKPPLADAKLKAVDGKSLTVAGLKGAKGTLVVFTCNHCPWAKAWEARVAEIGNAWSKKGFGVVAINPNDPSKVPEDGLEPMKERAKALGLQFPYVADAGGQLAKAYGATRTPEVYLFDAKDELVYTGAIDDNAEDPGKVKRRYLAEALEMIAAGKKADPAETKAIGCSIKP